MEAAVENSIEGDVSALSCSSSLIYLLGNLSFVHFSHCKLSALVNLHDEFQFVMQTGAVQPSIHSRHFRICQLTFPTFNRKLNGF